HPELLPYHALAHVQCHHQINQGAERGEGSYRWRFHLESHHVASVPPLFQESGRLRHHAHKDTTSLGPRCRSTKDASVNATGRSGTRGHKEPIELILSFHVLRPLLIAVSFLIFILVGCFWYRIESHAPSLVGLRYKQQRLFVVIDLSSNSSDGGGNHYVLPQLSFPAFVGVPGAVVSSSPIQVLVLCLSRDPLLDNGFISATERREEGHVALGGEADGSGEAPNVGGNTRWKAWEHSVMKTSISWLAFTWLIRQPIYVFKSTYYQFF
ncbi:hypothetical protein BHE74_00021105, partial [Ensete ventricosum]